jgi:hypothetical protein
MGLDSESREESGYLFVKARGENSLPAVREFLAATRSRAEQSGFMRVLIDGRDVGKDQKEIDRFEVGIAVAAYFPRPFRIAILRKREDITKFGENTAVNRGADFLVCTQEEEAVAWLLQS